MPKEPIEIEDEERRRLGRLARDILNSLEQLSAKYSSRYEPLRPPWDEIRWHMIHAAGDLEESTSDSTTESRLREDYTVYKYFENHPFFDVVFAKSKLESLLPNIQDERLKEKLQEIHRQIENLLEERRKGKVVKHIQKKMQR
jgi:hypothetical protein